MIEDQLREQMHRVDDLTPPPPPDFAGRAMRASSGADARRVDARDARRRTWAKALLGAAAAIAVGALAVTTLPHLGGSSVTSGSSAAGAAAPQEASGTAATTTVGPQPPTKEGDRPAGVAEPSASAPVTFYDAADCAGTLAAVRAALPALGKQGIQVASAACDARGVVVVRVSPALTPGQRGVLRARYGTRVSVTDLDGRPQP